MYMVAYWNIPTKRPISASNLNPGTENQAKGKRSEPKLRLNVNILNEGGMRKGMAVALVVAFLLGAGSSVESKPASSNASKSAWVLHQSSNYLGTLQTRIGPTGSSVTIDKLGLDAVSSYKSGNVLMMNRQDKLYVENPLPVWREKFGKLTNSKKNTHSETKLIPLKEKDMKISGYKTSAFKVIDRQCNGQCQEFEIWFCPDIHLNPEQREFAHTLLRSMVKLDKLPQNKGWPLRFCKVTPEKRITVIDTFKVERTAENWNATVPKGFKRVKDEVALMYGEDDENSDRSASMFHMPSH